jgi:hypothetical protein
MNGYLHIKTTAISTAHTTTSRTRMTSTAIYKGVRGGTAMRENGNTHKVTITASTRKHTTLIHIISLFQADVFATNIDIILCSVLLQSHF